MHCSDFSCSCSPVSSSAFSILPSSSPARSAAEAVNSMHFFLLLLALLSERAFAQEPPAVVCTGLAGCGGAIDNVLFTGALPVLIGILGNVAGAAAVIFIAVAGGRVVVAFG